MGITVLRWGWSEYESPELPGLPEGVEVLAVPEPDPPLDRADVLVVPSTVRVTADAVRRLRRCRLVVTTTSGFDQLDLAALGAAGIPAARLPLARRDAVVETTLAMMLALTRRLGLFQEAARAGRWERPRLSEYDARLLGTVGVVGVGVIGSRMVEVLTALGARVVRCDPVLPDAVSLEECMRASDVVTIHCDLNPGTIGLIDAAVLRTMRRGAILVNTARGAIVDVRATLEAVREKRLGGIGLDVFPEEPASLAGFVDPRVIVTPHAAGWHPGLGRAIADGVVTAVRALLEGREIPFQVRGR